jgi:hypothetical protein
LGACNTANHGNTEGKSLLRFHTYAVAVRAYVDKKIKKSEKEATRGIGFFCAECREVNYMRTPDPSTSSAYVKTTGDFGRDDPIRVDDSLSNGAGGGAKSRK